jgi:formate dehydrogenase subunit gamma
MVWLAPLLGVLAATFTRRKDPAVQGDRVLRHDLAAIVEHWAHGIGTAALIVTGIILGVLRLPALVGPGEPTWRVMDFHFAAAVLFLFGTFYYGANTLLAVKRFREHLPTKDAVEYTKRHYGLLLGFKQFTMPPERKYFESEKMAYLMAFVATATIVVTGLIKVAAHAMNVPAVVMGVITPTHDIATVVMTLFILPHIFFAAILPASWPILRSMFTGYVPLSYAKHEHAGWLSELGYDDEPEAASKKLSA